MSKEEKKKRNKRTVNTQDCLDTEKMKENERYSIRNWLFPVWKTKPFENFNGRKVKDCKRRRWKLTRKWLRRSSEVARDWESEGGYRERGEEIGSERRCKWETVGECTGDHLKGGRRSLRLAYCDMTRSCQSVFFAIWFSNQSSAPSHNAWLWLVFSPK